MIKRIFIVAVCLCGACTDLRPIDIENPSQDAAVICNLKGEVAYAGGTHKEERQLLIYPNTNLRSLQVAFSGQSHMRRICTEGDVCDVERAGSVVRISIKPGDEKIKIAPNLLGYEETYEFDQAKKTIVYQAGGGMDAPITQPFVGTCKPSPKVVQ